MEKKVIEVENLSTVFRPKKEKIRAIDGVSFSVCQGEMVGIVGESGCGKSVTSQSIMRLYDEKEEAAYSGSVKFEGRDLMQIPYKEMDQVRGNQIAMIFQDALSSLNPVYTVGDQVMEAILIHQNVDKKTAWEKAVDMLTRVRISEPEKRMKQYPHELSGGKRQRVMNAIALCWEPKLLIADEPTNGLDEAGRAQFFALLDSIFPDAAKLIITHDISVASRCDRVLVLCGGRMLETDASSTVLRAPRHPYTKALLAAQVANGMQPSPILREGVSGCPFYARCPEADATCLNGAMQKHTDGKTEWWCCHA